MAASIYESAGRDDLALQVYYKCYNESLRYADLLKRLEINHPDRALPFIGLGTVFYNSAEYELGARCFLAAKQIREEYIGPNSADTASCYNNLGCCLIKLHRNLEAFRLLKLSEAIF